MTGQEASWKTGPTNSVSAMPPTMTGTMLCWHACHYTYVGATALTVVKTEVRRSNPAVSCACAVEACERVGCEGMLSVHVVAIMVKRACCLKRRLHAASLKLAVLNVRCLPAVCACYSTRDFACSGSARETCSNPIQGQSCLRTLHCKDTGKATGCNPMQERSHRWGMRLCVQQAPGFRATTGALVSK